ncbi:hypothetical protein ACFZAV_42885 [Streptomyces sp. NPDC008343]|uniref:hypothetical protein n=1 Tax=Streptomyces sp. NPDC008343 TaxID=3364828 RepID=UPI0036F020A0
MANEEERTPQEWRELLRTSYDYPEEIEDAPRRKRRRLRRAHRTAQRERTAEWIREERRRDPLRPGAALVIVAAVLVVGALARYGPNLFDGDDDGRGRNVTATASASPTTDQGAAADSSPSPSASASPSPSASVDLSKPDTVAKEWARLYLTRNPPVDEDHTAAVRRAAPYSMPALTENLANSSDPAWNRLVSNGGVSTVGTVTVKPAGGDLPPDTPLRVWRTVTATVKVAGYTDYTEKTTIQAELTNTGDGWLVSRVVGV